MVADLNDVLVALGEVRGDVKELSKTVTQLVAVTSGWERRCDERHERVDENQSRLEKRINAVPERVSRVEDTLGRWQWYLRLTWGAIASVVTGVVLALWRTITGGR